MVTKIYGDSDDLIELEGEVYDEVPYYGHEKPIKIEASDGTKATIFYDGEWKINVTAEGLKFIQKVENCGEDGNHIGYAKGCTSYSDVLILETGIEWVKVGRKTFKSNN